MGAPRIPDFFVVGAPKSGTTALYNYLGQHPAIYMSPIKEPAFFAADLSELKRRMGLAEPDPDGLRRYLAGPMTEPRSGVVSDWDQYLRLFKNVRHETAIGEASGNYLGSSVAPRAIRERVPGARIVMILRDPVERLYSQYAEACSAGEAGADFLPWVTEQIAVERSRSPRLGPVWNGFYARHLRRYLDCFPPERLKIYFYEDYCRSPRALLRDLFEFLGVDADFTPDLSERHNVTLRPRIALPPGAWRSLRTAARGFIPASARRIWRAAMYRRPRRLEPAERVRVLPVYEDDIRELQGLVNRDLRAWMRPAADPQGPERV